MTNATELWLRSHFAGHLLSKSDDQCEVCVLIKKVRELAATAAEPAPTPALTKEDRELIARMRQGANAEDTNASNCVPAYRFYFEAKARDMRALVAAYEDAAAEVERLRGQVTQLTVEVDKAEPCRLCGKPGYATTEDCVYHGLLRCTATDRYPTDHRKAALTVPQEKK
jgi:hypothetical protein